MFRKDDICVTKEPVESRSDAGEELELASDFCQQVDEMVKRGAAIILTQEELENWNNDYYYYLPLVGVKGKKKWLCLLHMF